MGGARGRRISIEERQRCVSLINEACRSGARKAKACEILDISVRTLQRWTDSGGVKDDQRKCRVFTPANKLDPDERLNVLNICNKSEYKKNGILYLISGGEDEHCAVKKYEMNYQPL
jgi:transposase-like protein